MKFFIDYDAIRPHMPGEKLLQSQIDGMNAIISAFNKWGDGNKQRLAVILGTGRWETGHTFQPVKETQTARDKTPPSDTTVIRRLDAAFKAGKLLGVKTPYWRKGWFGRGFVQLTHEANYQGPARDAVLKAFGVDIHANRDETLRPDIAAFILVRGMLEGWFTGRKLLQYVDDLDDDDVKDLHEYLISRAVVNGHDKAKQIADYALQFEHALVAAPIPVTPFPSEPAGPTPPQRGFNWWKIGALLMFVCAILLFIFS